MANANQVIVNGETILDLRSDTVTPETLQKGHTAHDKSGTKITGTLEASSVSVQPSKSVTITSNGTVSVTPDAPYDALSSVDVTVNVSGGYNLKKVKYTASVNKLLKDVTITHNCGSIPKFVVVTSNNSNASYLMVGFGANESQTPSFFMMLNTGQIQASVTSTTFNYNNAGSTRYFRGTTYTYYFFY